ncbi:C-C chemokine receptor type 4-like [Coregonus clupeaformis]|uniref:C-C chemokine receptor type 4-like n=1 Tax=Coregonus clupeaformis TaxID=59861 RepID=UPI001E1C7EA4|nr:C-C chemokine receptor type 4-like [Coregonus clupeaformis]
MNTTEATSKDYYYDYYGDMKSPCSTGTSLTRGTNYQPILFYLVFTLGLTGNSMVLWVLLKYMKLKTMTDICLLNLALSDLLLALSLPLWAYNAQGHEFEGDSPCKIMAGVYQVGFYSSILFVTLMSVDRYLAIVHAVAAMRARTLRYGALACVIVWVASIAAALPEVIFAAMVKENDEESGSSCQRIYPEDTEKTWKLFRNFGENGVGLILCLPIMVFCYISILTVLQRLRNSKKDRAMKLIFAIVVVFIVSWVPYNVVVFLRTLQMFDIGNSCEVSTQVDTAMEVTETIALAHCCVNPVIYAFVGEKFRKCLGTVLSRYPLCKKLSKHAMGSSRASENETSNTPV